MKILITGFEPFGGEKINPSYEVVKGLKVIDGVEIVKMEVPTAFKTSGEVVIEKIREVNPDAVINIGQAGGRSVISLERVAINVDDARIADNLDYKPEDAPIDINGENAYFSTLPIKDIVKNIKDEGIPAAVSNSAGTYVCNHLMYEVLNYIKGNNLKIKAGFIHIPYLPEQVLDKPNTPSMSLIDMTRAIEIAVKTIIK